MLHEQAHIAGDLAEGAGLYTAGTHQGREPVAMGVPGRIRTQEAEFLGKRLSDLQPATAQSSQGTAGASELQNQSFGEGSVETSSAAVGICQPACGLQSKSYRRRGLQQGPSEHDGIGVVNRKTL